MELELRGAGGELLARLEPDDALLGAFPVSDGCGLHVGPQCVPKVTDLVSPTSPWCPHQGSS
uniref:Ubiquitin-like domain-containing protein n=1 Tax=Phasianus colchicus TaxID=9054 RepID=A0A669QX92_PHACC